MKNNTKILLTLSILGLMILSLMPSQAQADGYFSSLFENEDHEPREYAQDDSWKNRQPAKNQEVALPSKKNITPVTNELYNEECGSCHFPYQPELLPEGSWKKVMEGLADHFGDKATLAPEDHNAILDFLIANSADKSESKISGKFMRSLKGQTPLRISEIPYFKHEHQGEIRPAVFKRKGVGSVSNCERCHVTADRGIYAEKYVKIPKE